MMKDGLKVHQPVKMKFTMIQMNAHICHKLYAIRKMLQSMLKRKKEYAKISSIKIVLKRQP